MNKKSWILLCILGAGIAIVFYLLYTFDPERNNLNHLYISWTILSAIMVIAINMILNALLNRTLPWKERSAWRFIVHLVLGTLLSLFALNVSYQFIKIWITEAPPVLQQLVLLNVFGIAVLLPIYSVFFGIKFLRAWKKSDLETEILQKENARSQMMMLRNHLDPHFLFNNLNTLSSLIDVNPELSKRYLDKFAEVYRSILRTEQTDLTTVREELKMIDSYIFLLEIRFSECLFITIDVAEEQLDKAIPPLSIQMLIENALKHNIVSKKKPMHISVESSGSEFILVKNNLQLKQIEPHEVSGSGIQNIKKRYKFYTEQQVSVDQSEGSFIVCIPTLEVESI